MIRRVLLPFPLVSLSLLIAICLLPLRPSAAAPLRQTAGEIMAAVNALRQSRGLAPYTIDPGITAYAQEHSEYQARIDQSTHLHSDGQVSLAHGLVENVAGGDVGYLTAAVIVYEIWADPGHLKHMVGYESGAAGVGVASNSTTTFITLNVRPGGGEAPPTRPGAAPGPAEGFTPIALAPLVTATMRADGAILHEVGYGQTLWAIALAYGVPAARIRELNGMAADDASIWAGQRLLIVPAGLVTPTPAAAAAATGVALPAASTPTAVALRASATPSAAVATTPAAPVSPPGGSRPGQIAFDPIAAGLVGLAVIGLILFLTSGVKISRRR